MRLCAPVQSQKGVCDVECGSKFWRSAPAGPAGSRFLAEHAPACAMLRTVATVALAGALRRSLPAGCRAIIAPGTRVAQPLVRGFAAEPAEATQTEAEARMTATLRAALEAAAVEVHDVSGGCGASYSVMVESERFKGLTLIKQHRLVKEALRDEVPNLHALTVRTVVPQ